MFFMDKNHVLTKSVPPEWTAALDGWETYLRAAGRRERTVETRIRHVRQAARGLGVASPRDVDADGLMAWCGAQRWAPETRHAYYESLRGFYRWLAPDGDSPAQWLPVVVRRPGAPRPVPLDVLREGMEAAPPRTRLILCLAACAGLRASEIAQVHGRDVVEDIDGIALTVEGKGGRVRRVPLARWLARAVVRACGADGWCFPSKYGGHLSGAHVSKLGARALRDGWTLHTLRHRFATAAYSAERDLLAVQRLLGHASVATTQRYAEPPRDALRKAVEAADIYEHLQ